MTISDRLRRWGSGAVRRAERRPEVIDAVYDEDLHRILKELNLLDELESGRLRCAITGVPLTWENLGGMIGSPEGPRLISDEALHREHAPALATA